LRDDQLLGTYCIHDQAILFATLPILGGFDSDDEDEDRSAGLGLGVFRRSIQRSAAPAAVRPTVPTTEEMKSRLVSTDEQKVESK